MRIEKIVASGGAGCGVHGAVCGAQGTGGRIEGVTGTGTATGARNINAAEAGAGRLTTNITGVETTQAGSRVQTNTASGSQTVSRGGAKAKAGVGIAAGATAKAGATAGARDLAVFVLGWGANPAVVEHIRPAGFDKWVIYDYCTIEPVQLGEFEKYDNVWLFAWSFGVWAAERIFDLRADGGRLFRRTVALCGSPLPVHDDYGIPVRAFETTLKGISSGGDEKFNRRTYGPYYDSLRESLASRPWPERMEELETLYRNSTAGGEIASAGGKTAVPHGSVITEPAGTHVWTDAIAGSRDLIFPERNLLNYWGGKASVADMPHYPFGDAELIYRLIDETR